jgi:hypothetical protein
VARTIFATYAAIFFCRLQFSPQKLDLISQEREKSVAIKSIFPTDEFSWKFAEKMFAVSSCVFPVSPSRLVDLYWRVLKVSQNFGEKRADWQLAAHDPPCQEKWANLPAVRRGAMCVCVGCSNAHGTRPLNSQHSSRLSPLTDGSIFDPSIKRPLRERDAGPKCCVVQHSVRNISGVDLMLSVIYCVARDQDFTHRFSIRL